MVACALEPAAPVSAFFLEQLHGAMCRVRPEDTAFHHREAGYNFAIMAAWFETAETEASIGWVRRFWDAMQPFMRPDAYTNYLIDDDGDERVRAAYGTNYERLVALKRKYDPTNVFRLNQNVSPAG